MPGHTFVTLPVISDIEIGISQTKARFDEACFDELGCEDGIKALEAYQREYDEDNQVFKATPLHNWASNYADSFRQWGQYEAKSLSKLPRTDVYVPADVGVGM
jgi:hypothetical protein